jgi:hypothetical protein
MQHVSPPYAGTHPPYYCSLHCYLAEILIFRFTAYIAGTHNNGSSMFHRLKNMSPKEKADDTEHKKNKEQNACRVSRSAGDATKTTNAGDNRYDKK